MNSDYLMNDNGFDFLWVLEWINFKNMIYLLEEEWLYDSKVSVYWLKVYYKVLLVYIFVVWFCWMVVSKLFFIRI